MHLLLLPQSDWIKFQAKEKLPKGKLTPDIIPIIIEVLQKRLTEYSTTITVSPRILILPFLTFIAICRRTNSSWKTLLYQPTNVTQLLCDLERSASCNVRWREHKPYKLPQLAVPKRREKSRARARTQEVVKSPNGDSERLIHTRNRNTHFAQYRGV